MSFKCVGCDAHIPWEGEGLFSYTCKCGATVFQDEENGKIALPASLIRNLSLNIATPHLGDIVGHSDYASPLKEQLICDLRSKRFIWMGECEACQKNGTLKREIERRQHWAKFNKEHEETKNGNEQTF